MNAHIELKQNVLTVLTEHQTQVVNKISEHNSLLNSSIEKLKEVRDGTKHLTPIKIQELITTIEKNSIEIVHLRNHNALVTTAISDVKAINETGFVANLRKLVVSWKESLSPQSISIWKTIVEFLDYALSRSVNQDTMRKLKGIASTKLADFNVNDIQLSPQGKAIAQTQQSITDRVTPRNDTKYPRAKTKKVRKKEKKKARILKRKETELSKSVRTYVDSNLFSENPQPPKPHDHNPS